MSNKKRILTTSAVAAGVVGVLGTAGYLLNRRNLSIPTDATPIDNFDITKYLGKWYEIARLNYRYEKGLSNVTANYTMNNNGSISVVNKGYDEKKEEWESTKGKGKFIGDKKTGRLKVSFFGPIYSAYNIIALDKDYQSAVVVGSNTDYAWILSRTPELPEEVINQHLKTLEDVGVKTSEMVWPTHDKVSKSHNAVSKMRRKKTSHPHS